MPDVPVCFLVDGNEKFKELDNLTNVSVINKNDVKDDFLRNQSYGWGLTRLIAFWEAPYEYFLWLDSDTIIWGDPRSLVDFGKFDVITGNDVDHLEKNTNNPEKYMYDMKTWFFEIDKLGEFSPDYDLEIHDYFCPAVLYSKRGLFDLEEYKEILEFASNNPEAFKYGDMGIINYLINYSHQLGKIRKGILEIQYQVCTFDTNESNKRYNFEKDKPYIGNTRSTILHWPGPEKPIPFGIEGFYHKLHRPMTYFRMLFLKHYCNKSTLSSNIILFSENIRYNLPIVISRIKIKISQILKILMLRM